MPASGSFDMVRDKGYQLVLTDCDWGGIAESPGLTNRIKGAYMLGMHLLFNIFWGEDGGNATSVAEHKLELKRRVDYPRCSLDSLHSFCVRRPPCSGGITFRHVRERCTYNLEGAGKLLHQSRESGSSLGGADFLALHCTEVSFKSSPPFWVFH